MRSLAPFMFLAAAACGGQELSPVEVATMNGVAVLRQAPREPGKLVVADAVERYGVFRLRGSCLVLSEGETDYAPVFADRAAERVALGEVRGGGLPRTFELSGGPRPSTSVGQKVQAAGCGKPLFVVRGLREAEPSRPPGPPPIRPGR